MNSKTDSKNMTVVGFPVNATQEHSAEIDEWHKWRARLEDGSWSDAGPAVSIVDEWVARPGYRGCDVMGHHERGVLCGLVCALLDVDDADVIDFMEDEGCISNSMPVLSSIVTEAAQRSCSIARFLIISQIDEAIIGFLDSPSNGYQIYDFIFPAHRDVPNLNDAPAMRLQGTKVLEEAIEAGEAVAADPNSDHALEELFDTVHACETLMRAWPDEQLLAMRASVEEKNRMRGYYDRFDEYDGYPYEAVDGRIFEDFDEEK